MHEAYYRIAEQMNRDKVGMMKTMSTFNDKASIRTIYLSYSQIAMNTLKDAGVISPRPCLPLRRAFGESRKQFFERVIIDPISSTVWWPSVVIDPIQYNSLSRRYWFKEHYSRRTGEYKTYLVHKQLLAFAVILVLNSIIFRWVIGILKGPVRATYFWKLASEVDKDQSQVILS